MANEEIRYVDWTASEYKFKSGSKRQPFTVNSFMGCCQTAQVYFQGVVDDEDDYIDDDYEKDILRRLEDTKVLLYSIGKGIAIGCINDRQKDAGLGDLLERAGWAAWPDPGCQSQDNDEGGIFFYHLVLKKREGFVVVERTKEFA